MDYTRTGISSDVMAILPWPLTLVRVQKIKIKKLFKSPASVKGLLHY